MLPPGVPTVSVVVTTYRRRERLPLVLAPLLATDEALEVVVVVDGADDGSLDLLQELAAADGRLRPVWRENGGPSAARQTGVEHAGGEVVLLLDDDVVAGPGLVAGHAARHAGSRGLVVLGYMPTQLPSTRGPGQFATRLYATEYEQACHRYEQDARTVLQQLWTGNVSLRREDALRVGISAPAVADIYHEDTELGVRLASAGLEGVFDRSLSSVHLHSRDLPAFQRDARSQGRGRVRLAALHPGTVPPVGDQELLQGVPGPLAALAGDDRVLAAVCALLAGLVRGAGAVRAYGPEAAAARLLRRFEQVRGARAERTRSAEAPTPS